MPQHECLVLTMQQNQKYFALADRNGRLAPRFLAQLDSLHERGLRPVGLLVRRSTLEDVFVELTYKHQALLEASRA